MSFAEYPTLDAGALAALLRAGEVTPTEVRAAAEAAHTSWHGAINAVVEWYADPSPGSPGSPVSADLSAGPWAGVPMLRKDDGATEAGRLVERGSRLSAGWRAASTSLLFRRFAAAGLVVLGRSAVPEFILHATTESRVHGVTHNPWDRRWSAGGSSGGAAAAVAAGVVPVAHASDCAGSIRIPAAACGLIGLKPTRGRVPWGEGGVAGGWGGIAEELVVAHTVRDVQAVLEVRNGRCRRSRAPADGADPAARPLRVGCSPPLGGLATDPVLVRAVEEAWAGRWLAGLSAAVTPIRWPLPCDASRALMDPLFGAAALAEMEAVGAALGRPSSTTPTSNR
ncbi:MAG: amidase family protein [Acidimicrobiales bacterium]